MSKTTTRKKPLPTVRRRIDSERPAKQEPVSRPRQEAYRELAASASQRNLTPDPDVFIYSRWERFWMNVRAFFGAQP